MEDYREVLLDGLGGGILSVLHLDKIWEMIWEYRADFESKQYGGIR